MRLPFLPDFSNGTVTVKKQNNYYEIIIIGHKFVIRILYHGNIASS